MTDTRRKAQAMLNDARDAHVNPDDYLVGYTALCRAIEQHEAFRQEVSDAVEAYLNPDNRIYSHTLNQFIIPKPKPDPLVEAAESAGVYDVDVKALTEEIRAAAKHLAEEMRVGLEALGVEIGKKWH